MFTSHSGLAFLSVILREAGMDASRIGLVLSAPLVPILAGMYFSGHLSDRLGPLKVVRTGFFLMLISFISLQYTVSGFAGVMCSRMAYGFGYGIFMPAGMVYVKNRLSAHRMVYLVGVYGSMLLLPNLVGPAAMEFLYGRYGLPVLFWRAALPAAMGNALLFLTRPEREGSLRADPGGYLGVLRRPDVRTPSLLLVVVGLVYGFVPTLMALLLRGYGVPVARFFVPFTAFLFVGRFLVLPLIAAAPRRALVGTGLFLMAAAHLTVAYLPTAAAAAAAGAIFGLGYGFEYPTLSVWLATLFNPEDRGKPVALLNMVFHTGIFLTPVLGGVVMELWSLSHMCRLLAALALGTLLMLILVPDRSAGRGGKGLR